MILLATVGGRSLSWTRMVRCSGRRVGKDSINAIRVMQRQGIPVFLVSRPSSCLSLDDHRLWGTSLKTTHLSLKNRFAG